MKNAVALLIVLILLLSTLMCLGCDTVMLFDGENEHEQESSARVTVLPTCSEARMNRYRAIYQETGFNPVLELSYDSANQVYTNVKINDYYAAGFGKYMIVTEEEYKRIQDYQNLTGIQVIYPTVKVKDRPQLEKYRYDANIFYQVDDPESNNIVPALDQNGKFIPNYWSYAVDTEKPALAAEYNSIRIEGELGVNIDGVNCYYVYGRRRPEGVEVRVLRFAYYEYLKQTSPDSVPSEEQFFGWWN